jgi:hypothetical protein
MPQKSTNYGKRKMPKKNTVKKPVKKIKGKKKK